MTATTKKKAASYSWEVRERAVRLVLQGRGDHSKQRVAISSVSAKIGCTAETLREWVRQAERDGGQQPEPTSAKRGVSLDVAVTRVPCTKYL